MLSSFGAWGIVPVYQLSVELWGEVCYVPVLDVPVLWLMSVGCSRRDWWSLESLRMPMVIVTLRITTACPIPTLNASISNPTAHLARLCSLTFLIFLHCVPVLRRMIFRHASLSQRQGPLSLWQLPDRRLDSNCLRIKKVLFNRQARLQSNQ